MANMMVTPEDKPKLTGVELRWDHDYYDGPLSGVASWKGHDYWFQVIYEPLREAPRYWLVPLTDAELREEWRKHRLFERLVGCSSCCHGNRSGGIYARLRPRKEWEAFYSQYPPRSGKNPYSGRDDVGWFEVQPSEDLDPKLGEPCDPSPSES